MAVSSRYLRKRPRPRLGSYCCKSLFAVIFAVISKLVAVVVLGSEFTLIFAVITLLASRSVVGLDSSCRYSLTTVEQNIVGLLGNLTMYVLPSIVSRLWGLSQNLA
jgi:hypothetical protein